MPMTGWAIFRTKRAAEAFAAADSAARGYPRPGVPATPSNPDGSPGYGWTLRQADVVQHPDGTRWAYPLDGCSVALPVATRRVEALSDDWTPPRRGP